MEVEAFQKKVSIGERDTLPVQPSELSSLSEVGIGVPWSFPLSRSSGSVGNNTRAADGVTVVTVVVISITACPDTSKSTCDRKTHKDNTQHTSSSPLLRHTKPCEGLSIMVYSFYFFPLISLILCSACTFAALQSRRRARLPSVRPPAGLREHMEEGEGRVAECQHC